MKRPNILIIYTGGTIGMIQDEKSGRLRPFRLERVFRSIPSIQRLGLEIHALELEHVIDSSNVTPGIWLELAGTIGRHYDRFDGFVVLHGSDTMAYSASALSFLLENLAKPVIFTGSQLPIGLPRTDARENLITALEIAAMRNSRGRSLIPEVCIYFEDNLYRGNRTHKFNTENFDAFLSRNYPVLAEAGVRITVHEERLLRRPGRKVRIHDALNTRVATLQLFPGVDTGMHTEMYLRKGIATVILQTYGTGNAPTEKAFLNSIKELTDNNISVLNVTLCRQGHVEMGRYETSEQLLDLGVVSGSDITLEAAIAKCMFVTAQEEDMGERNRLLAEPLRGEMTT